MKQFLSIRGQGVSEAVAGGDAEIEDRSYIMSGYVLNM